MNQNPNVAAVELAAQYLGPLLDELVLVGGSAVGLLITDRARPPVRPTIDVDLLTEVTPTVKYYAFCEKLRAQGFQECTSDGVICRWTRGSLVVDVMPADEAVLGFSNRWYPIASKSAESHSLPSGRTIRVVSAPAFLATKLEAFASRGQGDFMHHDIEDIVTVIDGRPSIVDEVLAFEQEVQAYLGEEFDDLLAQRLFVERLDWHLAGDPGRKEIVLARLRNIAGV